MIIDMTKVKFKELSAAVKLLNDSNLLAAKIPTVGATKEATVKAFTEAVQNIQDDDDGNWLGPVEVANYYNSIVTPVTEPEKTEEKPSTKATEKAPAKEKTKPDAKKETEKKKENFTRVDSIYQVIAKSKGNINIKTIGAEANKIYAATGKKDNEVESKFVTGYVLNTIVAFGIGEIKDGMLTIKIK
jgi:hypothetical protein